MVKIGHARISENGTIYGKRGDQTTREVMIQNWYNHSWTHVFRPINKKDAEQIALAMEQICKNNNVGYTQTHDRTSLFDFAEKLGWDFSKVPPCNTDCSASVSACANSAGIKVSKNMWTGIEKQEFEKTGKTITLTDSRYLTSSNYLKRGDILLAKGHTAIVLSDGSMVTNNNAKKTEAKPNTKIDTFTSNESALQQAKSFNKSVSGKYRVMAEQGLNMRSGAGTSFDKIAILSYKKVINCYGYYTEVDGTKWLLVKSDNKVGYVSIKYLKRV